MRARCPSITIDFSCVTAKRGLVHSTSTPAAFKRLERRVVGAIAGRARRVQHHLHRDAAPMRLDRGVEQRRVVEGELLDPQAAPRLLDECEHRTHAVVRLDDHLDIMGQLMHACRSPLRDRNQPGRRDMLELTGRRSASDLVRAARGISEIATGTADDIGCCHREAGMDQTADFWALRECFCPPIPEIDQAAQTLSDAVDAMLAGNLDLARERVRQADMPALWVHADMIMNKCPPNVRRFRNVDGVTAKPSALSEPKGRRSRASIKPTAKRELYARDGWRCRFCSCRIVVPEARDTMRKALPGAIRWGAVAKDLHAAFFALTASLDHIVAHSSGGDDGPDNLVTTCWPCNFGRGNTLIEEVGLADPRLREPIVDDWDGLTRILHFRTPAPVGAQAG